MITSRRVMLPMLVVISLLQIVAQPAYSRGGKKVVLPNTVTSNADGVLVTFAWPIAPLIAGDRIDAILKIKNNHQEPIELIIAPTKENFFLDVILRREVSVWREVLTESGDSNKPIKSFTTIVNEQLEEKVKLLTYGKQWYSNNENATKLESKSILIEPQQTYEQTIEVSRIYDMSLTGEYEFKQQLTIKTLETSPLGRRQLGPTSIGFKHEIRAPE